MRLSLSAPLLASGLMLCFTSSHGDWTSPHPLQQEKAAPVPLIPFPSQVDWKTGTCPKKAPVSVKKNASLSKTLGKGWSVGAAGQWMKEAGYSAWARLTWRGKDSSGT